MVWKQRKLLNSRMERTPKRVRQLRRWLTSARRRRRQPSRGSCLTLQMEDSQVGRRVLSSFFFFKYFLLTFFSFLFRTSLSVAERRESSHCHEENIWDLAPSPWLLAAGWHHTVSFNGKALLDVKVMICCHSLGDMAPWVQWLCCTVAAYPFTGCVSAWHRRPLCVKRSFIYKFFFSLEEKNVFNFSDSTINYVCFHSNFKLID